MDCENKQTEGEKEQCYYQILRDIDDRSTCSKLPEVYREICYDIVENK